MVRPGVPWSLRSSWVGSNFYKFLQRIWPTKRPTRSAL